LTVELASLAELEPALAADGFFARDDAIARIYVGYRASDALRRSAAPAPPEPCRLPAVAYTLEPPRNAAGAYAIGDWRATWSEREYAEAVDVVRAAIAEGDVYQVNLVQHLSADFDGDPVALARALAPLRPLEPEPLEGDGWTIVSASPELLLSRRGSRIRTSPIKGTRPAGVPVESAKDAAEHVMIVDLERNDLSRVSRPGTVRWPELLAERELAGVTHLVATVEAELRQDVGLTELLEAVLPGGSVTGCPKVAALDVIAQLEPVGRGAAMGALGRIHSNGDLDLALTIRTFAIVDGAIHLWVGGGIVWDSDPADEVEESWVKARPLLAAIGAPLAATVS
jgi:para-aminobenzoate synthetase component I